MKIPERFNYFGVQVNATNLQDTIDFLLEYDYSIPNYVLFPDSSVIASSQQDGALTEILNHALLTLPDGLPSAIYARSKGLNNVSTVSGFLLCHGLLSSPLSHYFIGSTQDSLQKIKNNIEHQFPSSSVLGYASLPFHNLDWFKKGSLFEAEIEEINRLKPDLVWIGISSPKQDYLIKAHLPHLNRGILLGVGAVFDYLSGSQKKSPEWVKKIGLRWLWRLVKEPKRLGPKYWKVLKFYLSSLWKN